jgi:sensor histidine kinase YesM
MGNTTDGTVSAKTERNYKNSVMINLKHASRRYVLAQCAFWGIYTAINVLMFIMFIKSSLMPWVIGISLSVLLVLNTHVLRALYKTYALQWGVGKIVLHTVWMIPVSAVLVQYLVSWIIRICISLFPESAMGLQPSSASNLFMYSLNTMIILALWAAAYLSVDQFNRRRESDLAHWKTQSRLHQAELQFLRSQMNSHFIFNALNNLRALIRENPDLARERLTQLATLLRAILQADQRDKIALEEELEIVRGYLALEALQFEDRLQCDWQISELSMRQMLPPLALQTLVENAIKHGIACRRNGGTIAIRAEQTDGIFRLSVSNPKAETESSHESHGIGLKNVRERLVRVFGVEATLNVKKEQELVLAVMEIPQ